MARSTAGRDATILLICLLLVLFLSWRGERVPELEEPKEPREMKEMNEATLPPAPELIPSGALPETRFAQALKQMARRAYDMRLGVRQCRRVTFSCRGGG